MRAKLLGKGMRSFRPYVRKSSLVAVFILGSGTIIGKALEPLPSGGGKFTCRCHRKNIRRSTNWCKLPHPRIVILMNHPSSLHRLSSVLLIALLSIDVVGLQAQLAPRRIEPNTNHLGTQILEILAGANGDSSVQ